MNILFLLQRYPGYGGIETVTKLISDELCTHEDVNVVVFSTSSQDNPSQMIKHPKWKLIISNEKGKELHKLFMATVIANDIDVIVYQDSYVPEEYLLDGVNREKTKIIVCEHNAPDALLTGYWDAYKSVKVESVSKLLQKIIRYCRYIKIKRTAILHHRKLMVVADKYVLLSDNYRNTLKTVFGIESEKILAIGNPVSLPINHILKKEKEILFLGRLSAQKGVKYLLQIWKEFGKQHPDWTLIIVGDGECKGSMQKGFEAAGLRNVRFEGYQTDVLKYYQRASFFLMTSIYEGFPMVLYEAMSQGCIPIAFNSFASATDIIDDGINGFLVDGMDTDAYINKLNYIFQLDSNDKDGVRNSAIAKASANTTSKVVDKWLQLFNSII